jgi:hypothetical protein
MRIIATCMASNEGDIIEAFVRHNLGLLDALVVLDHASVDSTPQILAQLVQEGLPLTVLRDSGRAFNQGQRQTYLAVRFLAELDADFCFVLDADEFVKAPSRAALEAALAGLPEGAYGLVALQNYFGARPGAMDANPARRLTRRMRNERAVSRKAVLRRTFATEEGAQVSLGNHAAVRVRNGAVEPFHHALLRGVALAHFPVRSPEQIARKALIGWLSHRLTVPERYLGAHADQAASHWREIFNGLARGSLTTDARLVEEAILAYADGAGARTPIAPDELVDDPLESPYELRYGVQAAGSALATFAAWADHLVSDINAQALAPKK